MAENQGLDSVVSRETTDANRPPIIGITAYVEAVDRSPWRSQVSTVLTHDYLVAVEKSGGIPLLISPIASADARWANAILDRLDGLILAGGADVDPARYGKPAHPSVQEPRPDRDASELILATQARRRQLPLLGICRGMQVMAVAAGGELEQHIPDRVNNASHSPTPGAFGHHEVETVDGTVIRKLLGARVNVPTYHHQAVISHPGFVAAAWADDGTLEAMVCPDEAFTLAVQWHPEAGEDMALFEALVAAAREKKPSEV